jgi:hypothetical protein
MKAICVLVLPLMLLTQAYPMPIPSSPAESEEIPVYSGGGGEDAVFVVFLVTAFSALALCPREDPRLKGIGVACGVVSLGILVVATEGQIFQCADFVRVICCILSP